MDSNDLERETRHHDPRQEHVGPLRRRQDQHRRHPGPRRLRRRGRAHAADGRRRAAARRRLRGPAAADALRAAQGARARPPADRGDQQDRPPGRARRPRCSNEVFDLFIDLDAHEDQLDFPVLYTQRARRHLPPHAPTARTTTLRAAVRGDRRAHAGAALRPGRRRCQFAGHQPRLQRLRRPPGHRPHHQRHDLGQGERVTRVHARRRSGRRARSRSSTRSRACKRVEVDDGRAGRHRRDRRRRRRHDRRHARRSARTRSRCRRSRVDEPTIVDDLRDQQLAVRRAARASTSPRASSASASSKELLTNVAIRVEDDRDAGRLQGLGPRRAAARDPDRDDAPRGLRAVGRQADGRSPRRSTARSTSRWSTWSSTAPRSYLGVVTQKLGAAQGPHDQDGQPRHRPRAPRVPTSRRAA